MTASVETALRSHTIGSVVRLAGTDRYATAAAVAANAPDGTPAFVATGEAPWDALASAPLVASSGGTLLLTRSTDLPAVVSAALTRLAPSAVTVLGGTAAVSSTTELRAARSLG